MPTAFAWLQRWRDAERTHDAHSWRRLAILKALLLAVSVWVFAAPPAPSDFGARLPFASNATPHADILALQIFLALAAAMTSVVAVVASDNRGLLVALTIS